MATAPCLRQSGVCFAHAKRSGIATGSEGTRLNGTTRLLINLQPTELWGAVNAVSAALHSSAKGPGLEKERPLTHVAATRGDIGDALREALDYRPVLSPLEAAGCLLVATTICVAVYVISTPPSVSLRYAINMALLFATCLTVARSTLLERQYKLRLKPELDLADADSRFRRVEGINVHYKVAQAAAAAEAAKDRKPLAIAAYHGFGANTGSWAFVYKPLAHMLHAQMTMSDMPGFGLTQRPSSARYYTLQINGHFGREIMDAELEAAGLIPPAPRGGNNADSAAARGRGSGTGPAQGEAERAGIAYFGDGPAAGAVGGVDGGGGMGETGAWAHPPPRHPAEVATRVLMGHSMGAACCAAEAISHPEGVDALILVAPAVLALNFGKGTSGEVRRMGNVEEVSFRSAHSSREEAKERPAFARAAIAVAAAAATAGARAAIWVTQPLIVLALRAAVRSRAFWERGIGSAWFAAAGPTADLIDAYRRPQLVRGWEVGLIRFLLARVSGGRSLGEVVRDAYQGKVHPTQAELLARTVVRHDIKVLIVHGDSDALVPLSNSRRLAAMLPGARLEVFPQCGHVPQEELPDRFVETVADFVRGVQFSRA